MTLWEGTVERVEVGDDLFQFAVSYRTTATRAAPLASIAIDAVV
jgi:hypothetical protein